MPRNMAQNLPGGSSAIILPKSTAMSLYSKHAEVVVDLGYSADDFSADVSGLWADK